MKRLLIILLFPLSAHASHVILNTQPNISYDYATGSHPDTLMIDGNLSYGIINLSNVIGTGTHRIIIININAPVIAGFVSGPEATFEMFTCEYFDIVPRAGDLYGYYLSWAAVNGFEAHQGSRKFTMHGVKVDLLNHGTAYAGIVVRTYPAEGSQWGKAAGWFLDSVFIWGCYVANTGGEGFYIGCSHVGEKDTLAYKPVADWGGDEAYARWIHIFNDSLVNIGWDAIQVSGCKIDMQVVFNYIHGYAIGQHGGDEGGVTVNPGSSGKVSNNWIEQLTTIDCQGVMWQGQGGLISNNVIINAEWPISCLRSTTFNITSPTDTIINWMNNTIANATTAAVLLFGDNFPVNAIQSTNNCFGGYPTFLDIGNGSSADFHETTDIKATSISTILFVNSSANNYHLSAGSPCIAVGTNELSKVPVDFTGASRSSTFDVGAYLYTSTPPSGTTNFLRRKKATKVFSH